MTTFVDTAGRTWTVRVDVAAIKRVRSVAGVDLYGLVDDRFAGLGRLLGDPVPLVDVLYVLCRDAAERAGVTDEDFGRAMAGDVIERAANAFVEALIDFFPDPRVRAGLRRVIEAGRTVRTRLIDRMTDETKRIDVDSLVTKLSASSGDAPA